MPEPPASPVPLSGAPSEATLRALRLLVLVLGVVFVLCAGTFVYLLITVEPKSERRKAAIATAQSPLQPQLSDDAALSDAALSGGTIPRIALKEGEGVAQYVLEGSVVLVLIEAPTQSRLIRIDMSTGTQRTVALFSPQGPAPDTSLPLGSDVE